MALFSSLLLLLLSKLRHPVSRSRQRGFPFILLSFITFSLPLFIYILVSFLYIYIFIPLVYIYIFTSLMYMYILHLLYSPLLSPRYQHSDSFPVWIHDDIMIQLASYESLGRCSQERKVDAFSWWLWFGYLVETRERVASHQPWVENQGCECACECSLLDVRSRKRDSPHRRWVS